MNDVDVDLLVVGGGPVGLGTAIEARLAGLTVVVADPRRAPVDKACGEGLMPPAREALGRLGVSPTGRPFRGIRYVAPGAEASALFRTGTGLGVRRTTLSSALAARADALGVVRLYARADVGATASGRSGAWSAAGDGAASPGSRGVVPLRLDDGASALASVRWVVAADGLHSPTRRGLGLEAPPRGPARFGLRRHYRVRPWSDLVEVHWAHDCEAYVTPVDDDLVGVAVLCPGGEPYDAWLDRFPALRERLGAAEPAGGVRGAGPLHQVARRRVRGRTLLVGDAAGYVDALTGEGIAVGLLAAHALVGCLQDGRPQDYEAQWRRASRRYRLLTGALLAVSRRPVLRGVLVPAAQRAPAVFARAVAQLS